MTKQDQEKKEGTNWQLDDIIPNKEFDKLYQKVETELKQFKVIKKELSPTLTEKRFKEIMELSEEFKEDLSRLGAYTSLLLATDIKNQEARVFQSKLDNLSIKISEETLFLSHWIKGLPVEDIKEKDMLDDTNAKRLFKSIPDLNFSLNHSREAAKHTLSVKEEQLIHKKDTNGIDVISELYDLIVNDFIYTMKIEREDGSIEEKKIKGQEKVVAYVRNKDPKIRKAAYQALLEPYQKNSDKLFLIYAAIAKDWAQEAKIRKYPNSISVRNFANQIPDKVIETLLKTCEKNTDLFQEYFKIKAKMLGVKKLRRYDVYAPISQRKKEQIPFKEAKKIVFETFENFSPDFAQKAKSVLQAGHLDSHPKENKRNGAFCMSITPSILPYVLTNYTGRQTDVSTLAHELGHAVHDMYASKHYHSVTHAPLPLCETASTFGEMIVFEEMLSRTKSKEEKTAMLMDKLADSYATIIRQNYFLKFEILAHKALQEGINKDELSKIFFSTLTEHFGDAVEISEEFKYEWSYMPHIFHSPFYIYAYNFGELLSLALYARYKEEGKAFLPKLEKILKAGGSQDPVKLLKSVDVNITDAKFWEGGFAIIKGWLEEVKN